MTSGLLLFALLAVVIVVAAANSEAPLLASLPPLGTDVAVADAPDPRGWHGTKLDGSCMAGPPVCSPLGCACVFEPGFASITLKDGGATAREPHGPVSAIVTPWTSDALAFDSMRPASECTRGRSGVLGTDLVTCKGALGDFVWARIDSPDGVPLGEHCATFVLDWQTSAVYASAWPARRVLVALNVTAAVSPPWYWRLFARVKSVLQLRSAWADVQLFSPTARSLMVPLGPISLFHHGPEDPTVRVSCVREPPRCASTSDPLEQSSIAAGAGADAGAGAGEAVGAGADASVAAGARAAANSAVGVEAPAPAPVRAPAGEPVSWTLWARRKVGLASASDECWHSAVASAMPHAPQVATAWATWVAARHGAADEPTITLVRVNEFAVGPRNVTAGLVPAMVAMALLGSLGVAVFARPHSPLAETMRGHVCVLALVMGLGAHTLEVLGPLYRSAAAAVLACVLARLLPSARGPAPRARLLRARAALGALQQVAHGVFLLPSPVLLALFWFFLPGLVSLLFARELSQWHALASQPAVIALVAVSTYHSVLVALWMHTSVAAVATAQPQPDLASFILLVDRASCSQAAAFAGAACVQWIALPPLDGAVATSLLVVAPFVWRFVPSLRAGAAVCVGVALVSVAGLLAVFAPALWTLANAVRLGARARNALSALVLQSVRTIQLTVMTVRPRWALDWLTWASTVFVAPVEGPDLFAPLAAALAISAWVLALGDAPARDPSRFGGLVSSTVTVLGLAGMCGLVAHASIQRARNLTLGAMLGLLPAALLGDMMFDFSLRPLARSGVLGLLTLACATALVGLALVSNAALVLATASMPSSLRLSLMLQTVETARRALPAASARLRIVVQRESLFEATMLALATFDPSDVWRRPYVQFLSADVMEAGDDNGGLTKELFTLFMRAAASPPALLLVPAVRESIVVGPNSAPPRPHDAPVPWYRCLGRALALMVSLRMSTGIQITPAFFRRLRGEAVVFDDLALVDPELHASKAAWHGNLLSGETYGIELTFSAHVDTPGATTPPVLVSLCAGGEAIPVTASNYTGYLDDFARVTLTHGVDVQLAEMAAGFHELFPPSLCCQLSVRDWLAVVAGEPRIDIAEWQAITEVAGPVDYPSSDPRVSLFWGALHALTQTELAQLFQAITGLPSVPAGGLAALTPPFELFLWDVDTNHLPRASTCSNRLFVPPYRSHAEMLAKLRVLASAHIGFGTA